MRHACDLIGTMAMKEKEMSETILPILLKLNGVVYKFIVKGNDFYQTI
jgi:hypothetical protein